MRVRAVLSTTALLLSAAASIATSKGEPYEETGVSPGISVSALSEPAMCGGGTPCSFEIQVEVPALSEPLQGPRLQLVVRADSEDTGATFDYSAPEAVTLALTVDDAVFEGADELNVLLATELDCLTGCALRYVAVVDNPEPILLSLNATFLADLQLPESAVLTVTPLAVTPGTGSAL